MPTFRRPKVRRAAMAQLAYQNRPNFRDVLWGKCHGHCWYCGTRLTPAAATIDHLVPIVAGGRTVESNCVLACKPCNQAKGEYSVSGYRHLIGVKQFYGEKL